MPGKKPRHTPTPATAPVSAPASVIEPAPLADDLSLDDVAMLLVQLELCDLVEIEQLRVTLQRLARATDDFDAAVALGSAATQLAVAGSGGDDAVRTAALARANTLVESAMTRLDTIAAAAAPAPLAADAPVAAPATPDVVAALGLAAAELEAAMAADPEWADVSEELAAEEQAAPVRAAEARPALVPAPVPAAVSAPAGEPASDALPDDVDVDLLRDFIAESRDCIVSAEAALLALEHDPDDVESINTVFRAFHTIKGTSAFMGLGRISEFAHHAESLLSLVRDREIAFEGACADLSLRSGDMLTEMLAGVEDALAGGTLVVPDGYGALIASLEVAVTNRGAPPEDHATPAVELHPHLSAATGTDVAPDAPAAAAPERRAGDRRQGDRRQGERRQDAAASETSVRVRTDRLDRLIDMVGELVIAQSMIGQDPAVLQGQNPSLTVKVTHAGKLVRDLQDLAMSMRMVPLKATFQKLTRLVRDLAQQVGKQVELVTEGEDTEIDRNMVDVIGDPLVHMVRNALDHGLETPAERIAAGKSPVGIIRLRAYHAGGTVVVDLADDGRGLNRDRILAKARDRGIVARDKYLADPEIYDLIFAPGFSTAEQITDVSGRGVGMDVVKRNVESLRGRIEIASELGQGTTFSVRLPLTLAITDGMLVRVGTERYIVPTAAIQMSFRPEASTISTVNGRGEVVLLRDELMPIARVHRIFDIQGAITEPSEGILMIVGDQDRRTALLVDELLGQHQLVVKSLGGNLGVVPGVSGAAILGDGRVGLILDVSGLVALARTRASGESLRPAA